MTDDSNKKPVQMQSLIVGILSGIIAAILALISLYVSAIPLFSFLFFALLCLPIFIAAYGWGTLASVFSALTATLVVALTMAPTIAILFMLCLFGPTCYASWLLGLAKPDGKGGLIWYPLRGVLFNLTLFLSGIGIVIGLFLYNTPEIPTIAQQSANYLTDIMSKMNGAWTEQQIIETRLYIEALFVPLISAMTASYALACTILGIYLSYFAAKQLKTVKRPRDNWPHAMRLPVHSVFIFVAAFLLSLLQLPGMLILIVTVISSTFLMVLILVGLAHLHETTKPFQFRPFLLAGVYIALFSMYLTPFMTFVLIIMGLFASWQTRNPVSNSINQ